MRTIAGSLALLAVAGLLAGAVADDRSSEAPGRAPGAGFFPVDLTHLGASGMMAEEAADPAAVTAPAPAAPAPASPHLRNWTFGGYVETAYNWNLDPPENALPSARAAKENGLRVFDVNDNEFMLHAAQLSVEKAATEESWVGVKVVGLAGQDARWIHAAGLFDGGTGAASGDGEDFDLVDAYMTIKIPESVLSLPLSFVVGKWETRHGAEVLASYLNWNYSRSYIFGYAIPISHTGAMADLTLLKREKTGGELLGIGAGVVNGWDNVKDNNDAKSYMGQVRFQPCNAFETHTEVLLGPEQNGNEHDWRGLVDTNATINFPKRLEGLSLTGNFIYGWEDNASPLGRYAEWYGAAGYLKYRFVKFPRLKKWHVAFRGEWFHDLDGARTSAAAGVMSDQIFYEITSTIGFQPWESFLIRLEHRYDKAQQRVFTGDDDAENHINTIAVDLVVLF